MTSTTSAAPAFKQAMYEAANTLFNPEPDPPTLLLTYGMPAFDTFNDVISIGAVTVSSEPATLTPRRTREETLTQQVIIYCFQPGGQEQELVVLQRAYTLLGQLEEYVRVTDTTLGGAVLYCFLTDHESDAATDQDVLSKGRMQVLNATFTAHNRITS